MPIKRLLLNLIILSLITVILQQLLFGLLDLPPFWANPTANGKEEYLRKQKNDINCLFIGTSKTLYHTDINLFDSLTNHTTNSFNFGVEAAGSSEISSFVDRALEMSPNVKYLFVEIYDFEFIEAANLNTSRVKYNYSFDKWLYLTKALWSSNYGFLNRLWGTFRNTIAMGEWLIKFDLLNEAVSFKSGKLKTDIPFNEKGYVPLTENSVDRTGSRKEFLKDTSIAAKQAAATNHIFRYYNSVRFDKPLYNHLLDLEEKCDKKGIRLFIVLGPDINEAKLANIVPVFIKLENKKFNFADPGSTPEFYQSQYLFDHAHLNEKGARIYTTKLAKAFTDQLQ